MKKILLTCIIFLIFFGCKSEKKIEKIEINPSTVNIKQYENIRLSAKILYSDNKIDSTSTITWQSNDTTIAKVNSTGILTGIGIGTASIKAIYSGKSNQINASVIENPLFKVKWILTSIQDTGTGQLINYPDSFSRKGKISFSFGRFSSTDSIDTPNIIFRSLQLWRRSLFF